MKKKYMTKSRSLILNYIQGHKDTQFSATDMIEYLQEEGCQTNIATVYRNLDRLSEEGTLIKYKYPENDCSVYQYAGDQEECQHHLHMKCQSCGKLIHLECAFMKEISDHMLHEHGFMINCKGSVIMGVCEDCRSEKKE